MASALRPTADCFAVFYRDIHEGREPRLWQQRAATELASGQRPWTALRAPTGSGKTTLVDCFLFALACASQQPPRRFPVRLFWVVDRRSVVDQVYAYARLVVNAIAGSAPDSMAGAAGTQLAQLATGVSDDEPVQVRLWRGGFAGETSFEADGRSALGRLSTGTDENGLAAALVSADRMRSPLSPCAPAIICSTVDQIGSRLLFRGYGVSRRSRPIEAALVATDSLIVLDEAHLSAPFRATASTVAQMQQKIDGPFPPLQVLPISATHQDSDGDVFELGPKERTDPQLVECLRADKPVELVRARNPVKRSVTCAREMAQEGAIVIGVVANTVATARAIASSLHKHGEVLLIIGPSRPLDRVDLLGQIPDRQERDDRERPLFIVGTQTIEVGLDLDLDGLVTACAPLPALIQRFGRLDRAGKLSAGGQPGRGAIVQPQASCPVYGEATLAAWHWLNETAQQIQLNFGPERVSKLVADAPAPTHELNQPTAPLLGPWHVATLVQTSHDPQPDQEVSVFLHGESALEPADVQICWRADLEQGASDWVERVRARLPHGGELLSLPARSVRRWLMGSDRTDELADIEGLDLEGRMLKIHRSTSRETVIRVPPPDPDGMVEPQLISPSMIRSGEVIVLPAYYGGCDRFGWAPASRVAVSDLGNFAQTRTRLLLAASVGTPERVLEHVKDTLRGLQREEISEEEAYARLREPAAEWLTNSEKQTFGEAAALVARGLGERLPSTGRAIRFSNDRQPNVAELLLVPSTPRKTPGRAVLYHDHVEHVVDRVTRFIGRLGLPDELGVTLTAAAQYHDVGKLDPRFQKWLNDGSPPSELLAKSGRNPNDRRSRAARLAARWPIGKRHEATAAAVLDAVASWPAPIDRDLLIYLVAAHHGDGRPFRTHALDPAPVTVKVTLNGNDPIEVAADATVPWSEHARRFYTLNERFGPWGLAALESLLVLADRGASAEEGS
jgi:CRISPR-associated endonuclease/helicase Cas3